MPERQNRGGAIAVSLAAILAATPALSHERPAATASEIVAAIAGARPGDVVVIQPGIYRLPRTVIRQSGRPGRPITVRALRPGAVELRSKSSELFKINGADWIFADLDIAGACPSDAQCEHAFHIVGGADRTILRGNRVRDFNAQIKGNGEGGRFPHDVVIDGNTLFDTHRRAVDLPLAAVDVVGGRHWVVRDNLIADFGKAVDHPPQQPDDFGYAVFLKGNGSRGVIEHNLIACGLMLPPAPYTRGISLGGSGTTPGLCDKTCSSEHRGGLVRDNVVLNCPTGAGIYLYKSADSRVEDNTLIATEGVLADSPISTARLDRNLVSRQITATNGARMSVRDNLVTGSQLPVRYAAADDLCDATAKLTGHRSHYGASGCRGFAQVIADYREYVRQLPGVSPAAAEKPARPSTLP